MESSKAKSDRLVIALLVINTMSLFEIIYLIVTNPKYKESEKE